MEIDPDKVMHVYGPRMYHDGAHLVGTRQSLTRLRGLIDEALKKGQAAAVFTVNDDEGYQLGVIRVEEHQLPQLAVPYWQEFAQETREDALHPDASGVKARLVVWRRSRSVDS